MSDITKCTGEGCPVKETCRRFTARSNKYQSYFVDVPLTSSLVDGKKISSCEYYWDTEPHLNKITE